MCKGPPETLQRSPALPIRIRESRRVNARLRTRLVTGGRVSVVKSQVVLYTFFKLKRGSDLAWLGFQGVYELGAMPRNEAYLSDGSVPVEDDSGSFELLDTDKLISQSL